MQQCSMHLKCFIVAFELNIRKIPLIDLDAKSYIVLKDIIGKTLHKNQGKDAQTSLSAKHYILLSSWPMNFMHLSSANYIVEQFSISVFSAKETQNLN